MSDSVLDLLNSETPQDRAKVVRALIAGPDARPEVVARLEVLLEDRACARISIPYKYGEIRVVAAEALAEARAAIGDRTPVVLENAPRPLTAEKMAPLEEGLDIPNNWGPVEVYEALREHERLPTTTYTFDPTESRWFSKEESDRTGNPRPDMMTRLNSKEPRERIKGLRRLSSTPDLRPEVVVRVKELLEDRTVDIIRIPIRYGEVRMIAAEALASIRAAQGDSNPVVLENAPRPLTAERMAPLKEGGDLQVRGAIKVYEALRELGRLPTTTYRIDPAEYRREPAEPDKTRYFIAGARPVKLVPTPDGGLDVQAIDWNTGEFVREMSYLSRISRGDHEIDEVNAKHFAGEVKLIRERLVEKS